MIEIAGLKKCLNRKWVLDGIDLTVREGESVAVMGPSGTGKSVLLKHIVGLLDPDAGTVRVDGMSVPDADADQIQQIRNRISYVFQNSALFDSLTVEQNIRLGLPAGTASNGEGDDGDVILRSLEVVNLDTDVLPLLPAELSGGMQKRVAIARAIVGRKKYVLYDEPTTGLDPVNSEIINQLIARLTQQLGTTNMVVTHDVRSAFFLADRVALLMGGSIRALGTPEELKASEDTLVKKFLTGGGRVPQVA